MLLSRFLTSKSIILFIHELFDIYNEKFHLYITFFQVSDL